MDFTEKGTKNFKIHQNYHINPYFPVKIKFDEIRMEITFCF